MREQSAIVRMLQFVRSPKRCTYLVVLRVVDVHGDGIHEWLEGGVRIGKVWESSCHFLCLRRGCAEDNLKKKPSLLNLKYHTSQSLNFGGRSVSGNIDYISVGFR